MTGTEVATRYVPMPGTGQAVDLNAPTEKLAEALDVIRGWETEARDVKRQVAEEIRDRMRSEATGTLRVGGYELKGSTQLTEQVWDISALQKTLYELIDGQRLPPAWFEKVLRCKEEWSVNAREMDRLLRDFPEVADRIIQHRHEAPKPARVSVSRS